MSGKSSQWGEDIKPMRCREEFSSYWSKNRAKFADGFEGEVKTNSRAGAMLRRSWPTQSRFPGLCVLFLVRFGLIWYILSLGFVCFDFRGLLREEEFEVGCVGT